MPDLTGLCGGCKRAGTKGAKRLNTTRDCSQRGDSLPATRAGGSGMSLARLNPTNYEENRSDN